MYEEPDSSHVHHLSTAKLFPSQASDSVIFATTATTSPQPCTATSTTACLLKTKPYKASCDRDV